VISADYAVLGLNQGEHIMRLYARLLPRWKVTPSDRLAHAVHASVVRVAGVVASLQRPGTAKGYVFLTLEDEAGFSNVILNPQVYAAYRRVIRWSPILMVEGRLQHEGGVVNVLGQHARSLVRDKPVENRRSNNPHRRWR
jgi:error-prone DNA polymerase